MAKPLRGYTRLPGTARQYRTPSGRVISRYQYDSIRARAAGWRNRAEVERFRQSPEGSAWHFRLTEAGADATYSGRGMRSARDLERERATGTYGGGEDATGRQIREDRSPTGPLAGLLVELGRRDPTWQFDVGDTPAGMSTR